MFKFKDKKRASDYTIGNNSKNNIDLQINNIQIHNVQISDIQINKRQMDNKNFL